jgi:methanogenic corrinoid protein MtbC1
MNTYLQEIAACVEAGKIDKASPYPPAMSGREGAYEYTVKALESGYSAEDVLEKGLMVGMDKVGRDFRDGVIFVPQVLMSARAMSTAMELLKPQFISGSIKRKGKLIMGTVQGDVHDIGKNLVSMMAEGNGYQVIDLGVDVKPETFIKAADEHTEAVIGLSCLLTTTMPSMEKTVRAIKSHDSSRVICVGGAPINPEFSNRIGADHYSPDPQGAVEFLNAIHSSRTSGKELHERF